MSNTDIKIGSDKDINKNHKKFPLDELKMVIPVVRHDLKMLTEKHNDEKLAIKFLIVKAGLNACHFW